MKKIFISSVISGYEDRRNSVEEAIQNFNRDSNLDFVVIGFDQRRSPSLDKSSQQACLDGVSDCDIYLGIYPKSRYGWDNSPIEISPTHEEYREARKKKKIILVFVESLKEGELEDPKQKKFLNEVGDYVDGRFWNEFDDLAGLEYKVHRSLVNLLNNDFKLFLSDYKQKILDNFKLVGEAEVDYSVPLEDILQLNLIENIRTEECAKNESGSGRDSIAPSNNIQTLCTAINKYERIIILGDPGSGKSTSLKWLTRKLAKDILSESRKENLVPIHVELRWYKNNLLESILMSLRENGVECNKENIEKWYPLQIQW